MIKALTEHLGISFTSSRAIGLFKADYDLITGKYTLICASEEEEGNTIFTWVLKIFFITLLIAMTLPVICCCLKRLRYEEDGY